MCVLIIVYDNNMFFFQQQQPQQQKPVRDHAAAAAPAASDPLADLFASAATLAPSGAAATDAAPSASPRMATADIMALYGARSPGAGTVVLRIIVISGGAIIV